MQSQKQIFEIDKIDLLHFVFTKHLIGRFYEVLMIGSKKNLLFLQEFSLYSVCYAMEIFKNYSRDFFRHAKINFKYTLTNSTEEIR